jgi:hypothetical protein
LYILFTQESKEKGGKESVIKFPKRKVCRSIGDEVGMYVCRGEYNKLPQIGITIFIRLYNSVKGKVPK